MTADPFFDLPRTTRAADWFERILPSLPLRLPAVTTPLWSVFVVHGVGGGTWSVRLEGGKVATCKGIASPVGVQIAMSTGHFREAIGGALRQRLATVLTKLGKPVALPDLARWPVDLARLDAASAVGGSVAVVLHDKQMAEAYRYVITLGNGPADFDTARTTIETDLDDLATLVAARTPPVKLLTSGKLRIAGDVDLPLKVLTKLVN